MKVNNKKGFTLAELLIVVAIIGVLIAIAMPTFSGQLEKAREATDEANCRAAYGQAVADYLLEKNPTEAWTESVPVGKVEFTASVDASGVVTVTCAKSEGSGNAAAKLESKTYQNAGIKCVGGVVDKNA